MRLPNTALFSFPGKSDVPLFMKICTGKNGRNGKTSATFATSASTFFISFAARDFSSAFPFYFSFFPFFLTLAHRLSPLLLVISWRYLGQLLAIILSFCYYILHPLQKTTIKRSGVLFQAVFRRPCFVLCAGIWFRHGSSSRLCVPRPALLTQEQCLVLAISMSVYDWCLVFAAALSWKNTPQKTCLILKNRHIVKHLKTVC